MNIKGALERYVKIKSGYYVGERDSQLVLVVKSPPGNAGDIRDVSLISGSGISPGEGNGYPIQYSCLENLMDRGVQWATVHGVTKSWTLLSD